MSEIMSTTRVYGNAGRETFPRFCIYTSSTKDLRQLPLKAKYLCFERDFLGCDKNHDGSARHPEISPQNSLSLSLTTPQRLTSQSLSDPKRNGI